MLEFFALQRVVVAPQVQALLGVSARVAQQLLRNIDAGGYAHRERIFAGQEPACRITARGLGAIGSRLSAPKLDLACYQHDVGLGWLWLAARSGSFGPLRELHSEREMRSQDARADREGAAIGIGLGEVGANGRQRLHYPDLLLSTPSGQRIAIELELTGKGRRRLERIMESYAADPRIDAVLYLVADRPLGRRVEQAARTAGIAQLVHVQALAGPPQGAPDHRRTLGRRPQTRFANHGAARTGGAQTGPALQDAR